MRADEYRIEKIKPTTSVGFILKVVWGGIEPPTQGFSVLANMVLYGPMCPETIAIIEFSAHICLDGIIENRLLL